MKPRQPSRIQKEIDKVNELILENEELIEKYPEEIGLELDQWGLENRKSELITELMKSNEHYNIDYFSVTIDRDNPPIKDVLEVSYALQKLAYPLAQAYEGPVERGTYVPTAIKEAATFGLAKAAEISSLTLFFRTTPLKNDSQKRFVTLVRTAMDNLNTLISCEDNPELIQKQTKRLGTQSIDKYKEFLDIVSKKELDIKLFDIEKPKDYKTRNITKEFAESVYQVITETKKPTVDYITVEGELGIIDAFSQKFIIKDANNKKIHVYFDEHFAEQVKNRWKKIIKAEIKVTKTHHVVEDRTDMKMELNKFII